MRRTVVPIVLLFMIFPLTSATAVSLGVGVSGGMTFPILLDDQGTGSNLTVRAILRPIGFVGIEGSLSKAKFGDPDIDMQGVTDNLEGSDLTAYGLNAVFGGSGGLFNMFFIGGIGFFDMHRDQTEAFDDDGAQFGWVGGLGMGFGLASRLTLDVRAQLNIVPVHDRSSRKFAFLLAGLNFYVLNR